MTNYITPVSYIEVLAAKFPRVQVTATSEGTDYEYIRWQSGEPLPSKAELDLLKLEMDRDRVWRRIQEIRDTRKAGGVKVGDNWFHSDDTSRIQQLGLVMFGANLPTNIQWKTMSNNYVLMTPQLAQQIFMSVAINDQKIFAQAEVHRLNMLKTANPYEYDFSTGWQPIFGE